MNLEQMEQQCINYLSQVSNPLVPVDNLLRHLWQEEEFAGLTRQDLLSYLRKHEMVTVVDPERDEDPERVRDLSEAGLASGPRVILKSRTPTKAEMSDLMKLLCGYAQQLISLPSQGHESSRLLYFEYADALEKYSHELVAASGGAEPWREMAAQAAQAGKGLWQTTDAGAWKAACERLAAITDQERDRARSMGVQPVAQPEP